MSLRNQHGAASVSDSDLWDMMQGYGKILEWLRDPLEELQYFRDMADSEVTASRVAYLEGVLDSVGAQYDKL